MAFSAKMECTKKVCTKMKDLVKMGIEDFFDVSQSEVDGAVEAIARYAKQDGRICVCGHTMKSHSDGTYTQGVLKCSALKDTCSCRSPRAVVESSNGRYFLKKTHGSGGFHALVQGIDAAIKAGHTVEWIGEQKCDRCNKQGKTAPCVMRQDGRLAPSEFDTGIYALLCDTCRTEL